MDSSELILENGETPEYDPDKAQDSTELQVLLERSIINSKGSSQLKEIAVGIVTNQSNSGFRGLVLKCKNLPLSKSALR